MQQVANMHAVCVPVHNQLCCLIIITGSYLQFTDAEAELYAVLQPHLVGVCGSVVLMLICKSKLIMTCAGMGWCIHVSGATIVTKQIQTQYSQGC